MESTAIRQVIMTAMLVGPNGDIANKLTAAFQETRLRVVRVAHVPAACERLPIAMPQVVIVIGALRAEERDELVDRVTAVGALVMYAPPGIDDRGIRDLVFRAAQAAIERKLERDESGPAGTIVDPPGDDEVDSRS